MFSAPFEASTLKWDLACMCFHVLEYVIYANILEYILEKTKKISFMYLCIMSHIQHWFKKIKIVRSLHVPWISLVYIKYRKLKYPTQHRYPTLAGKLNSFLGSSVKPSCKLNILFSFLSTPYHNIKEICIPSPLQG